MTAATNTNTATSKLTASKHNSSKKYKTLKVFDCQDMPKALRQDFMENEREGLARGNDCYIDWRIYDKVDPHKTAAKVDKWLIAHGAKENEEVLIRHWW